MACNGQCSEYQMADGSYTVESILPSVQSTYQPSISHMYCPERYQGAWHGIVPPPCNCLRCPYCGRGCGCRQWCPPVTWTVATTNVNYSVTSYSAS